jgi:hypothetical protein
MESYVVRIYRRSGKKFRILIGTVEVPGTDKRMSFSNVEELWGILTRRKGLDHCVPPRSATPSTEGGDECDGHAVLEESPEGVRQVKPALEP